MTSRLFSELGLSAEVLKAIDKLGFEQASPIQAETIPLLLQGRDVVGQSQTGSGKTAAFAVPAIEKVDPQVQAVQVLVLCPTRELAVQVAEEVHKLALFKRGIHALPIYGGQSYERQFQGLRQGAQIVIGTPGRVMDHMRRGTLRLDAVKLAVLDEADEMLDMGFREDIEFILQAVPATRQTVFFSATMPRAIQELIQRFARAPQQVRIEQKAMTVPTVEQVYYEVGWGFKLELLTRLIDLHDLRLGIIFCNTKRAVDELTDHLNTQGYSADRLHGDMTQAMRDRVMGKFRKSGLEFLVATDVAARGIDVDDVQVVFNYDLPYDGEDYLHRIGRTGRAGRSGLAVSFVSGRELFRVQQIERFTRVRIRRVPVPTRAEVEEARANQVIDRVRATLQAGKFKRQDHVVERLLEEGFTSTDIISASLHILGGAETIPTPKAAKNLMARTSAGQSVVTTGSMKPVAPAPASPVKLVAPAATEVTAPTSMEPAPVKPATPVKVTSRRPGSAPEPGRAASVLRVARNQETGPSSDRPDAPPTAVPGEASGTKVSRRTPADQLRLFINLGSEAGLDVGHVVGAILGETGLPGTVVGTVDIRERHTFVDVATDSARAIISKLNRSSIKGHRVKVKVA
jgi:ATP-dependent RNA helicase DeaD